MKKKIISLLLAVMMLVLSMPCCSVTAEEGVVQIYVDGSVNTSGDGSLGNPVKTIIAALNKAAAINGSVDVILRGGRYELTETLSVKWTKSGNLTIKGYEGETAELAGSVLVNSEAATVVESGDVYNSLRDSAKGKVVAIDLSDYGIDDYGTFTDADGYKNKTASQLYYGGNQLTVARYPNFGYTEKNKLTYDSRWASEQNAVMTYYETSGYASHNKKVSFATSDISVANPTNLEDNAECYLWNMISEIDIPGEYCIDTANDVLYLYPPYDTLNKKLELSVVPEMGVDYYADINDYMLIDVPQGTKNVLFENLVISSGAGTGINIFKSDNIFVRDCVIKNFTGDGISIFNSTNVKVDGCDIFDVGFSGVWVAAGGTDASNVQYFYTLTPSGIEIKNNDIHDFAIYSKADNGNGILIFNNSGKSGAASYYCVAPQMKNNRIHNAPSAAIAYQGAIEAYIGYNEIYDVCKDMMDFGAVYAGRRAYIRGTVIENNFFHDLVTSKRFQSFWSESMPIYGIYADDNLNDVTARNNVFYNCDYPMIFGGGSDHEITNNLFVDCENTIRFDARGLDGTLGANLQTNITASMKDMEYDKNEAWKTKYPEIGWMMDTITAPSGTVDIDIKYPQRNTVGNNVLLGSAGSSSSWWGGNSFYDINSNVTATTQGGNATGNNVSVPVQYTSGYTFADKANYNLNLTSIPSGMTGFATIDTTVMGVTRELDTNEFNLVYPSHRATGVATSNVDFLWEKYDGADAYKITVASDDTFNTKVVDGVEVSTNSYTASSLSAGTYYWKVETVKKSQDEKVVLATSGINRFTTIGATAPAGTIAGLDLSQNKMVYAVGEKTKVNTLAVVDTSGAISREDITGKPELSYEISDPICFSVDEDGYIKARAKGSAELKVSYVLGGTTYEKTIQLFCTDSLTANIDESLIAANTYSSLGTIVDDPYGAVTAYNSATGGIASTTQKVFSSTSGKQLEVDFSEGKFVTIWFYNDACNNDAHGFFKLASASDHSNVPYIGFQHNNGGTVRDKKYYLNVNGTTSVISDVRPAGWEQLTFVVSENATDTAKSDIGIYLNGELIDTNTYTGNLDRIHFWSETKIRSVYSGNYYESFPTVSIAGDVQDGSRDVAIDANVQYQFSKVPTIDGSLADAITMKNYKGQDVEFTATLNNRILTIAPTANLIPGKRYTVMLDMEKITASGEAYEGETKITFTAVRDENINITKTFERIDLSSTKVMLAEGETTQIEVSKVYGNDNANNEREEITGDADLTYTNSNPYGFSIDEFGIVTAKHSGYTTITVSYASGDEVSTKKVQIFCQGNPTKHIDFEEITADKYGAGTGVNDPFGGVYAYNQNAEAIQNTTDLVFENASNKTFNSAGDFGTLWFYNDFKSASPVRGYFRFDISTPTGVGFGATVDIPRKYCLYLSNNANGHTDYSSCDENGWQQLTYFITQNAEDSSKHDLTLYLNGEQLAVYLYSGTITGLTFWSNNHLKSLYTGTYAESAPILAPVGVADGDAAADITSKLRYEFGEVPIMEDGYVLEDLISVKDSNSADVDFTASLDGKVITITFAEELLPKAQYSVDIDAEKFSIDGVKFTCEPIVFTTKQSLQQELGDGYKVVKGSVVLPSAATDASKGTKVAVDGDKIIFTKTTGTEGAFSPLELALKTEANADKYVLKYKMKLNAQSAADANAFNQMPYMMPIQLYGNGSGGIQPIVYNSQGQSGTWNSKGSIADYINKEIDVYCEIGTKKLVVGTSGDASSLVIDAGTNKIDLSDSYYTATDITALNTIKFSFREQTIANEISFELYDFEVYSVTATTDKAYLNVNSITTGGNEVANANALKGKTASISYDFTNLKLGVLKAYTIIAAAYDKTSATLLSANYKDCASIDNLDRRSGIIDLAVPSSEGDLEIYIYAWDGIDKLVPLVTKENIFEN